MSKGSQPSSSDEVELPKVLKEKIEEVVRRRKLNKEQAKRLEEEVKKAYLKSSWEPGEAIGLIAAQSISEPATQMCLDYEERILVREGDRVFKVPVGVFVDRLMEVYGYTSSGGVDALTLPEGVKLYALALDEKERLRWKRITGCVRLKTSENLLRVVTKSGRKVLASKSHAFVIKNNGGEGFVNVKGSELRVGMKVPIVKFLPHNCLETLRLRALGSEVELDELFGFFLGAFASGGFVDVDRGIIRISCPNEDFAERIEGFLERFSLDYEKRMEENIFLLITSHPLSGFLTKSFGAKPEERKIPNFVFSAKESFVSGFLRAIFDGKGKLDAKNKTIKLSSQSEGFIDGVKLLLARLGIFSRKSVSGKSYELRISFEDFRALWKGSRGFVTATSYVVWDDIVEIEEVPPSREHIYDISVEEAHTFATFDGIIVHNTMRTYHVAGAAVTKVTYGLPRLIEIVDAKKTPETPQMKIYLKSGYNTEKAAREFAEKIIERSLSDVASRVTLNLEKGSIEVEIPNESDVEKAVSAIKKEIKEVRVRSKKNGVVVTPKKEVDVKELERIKERVLNVPISPIKGIKNAMIKQEGNRWVIMTVGSNLREILRMEEVDARKTVTNNIHEVAEVLGIEAARNLIAEEIMNTLNQQGLDVDRRHVELVADIMTFSGRIMPIGRYGVAGSKTSVLARAAFEETIKHLIRAAVKNEAEEFKGIFENVMVGHVVPAGTGMFDLVARFEGEEEGG